MSHQILSAWWNNVYQPDEPSDLINLITTWSDLMNHQIWSTWWIKLIFAWWTHQTWSDLIQFWSDLMNHQIWSAWWIKLISAWWTHQPWSDLIHSDQAWWKADQIWWHIKSDQDWLPTWYCLMAHQAESAWWINLILVDKPSSLIHAWYQLDSRLMSHQPHINLSENRSVV